VPPGTLVTNVDSTVAAAAVTIGGIPATVLCAGLVPGFAGLYQLIVVVPQNIPTGNQPILIQVNGGTSPTGACLKSAPGTLRCEGLLPSVYLRRWGHC
jgi:uncharacterized protein (TIGR03437 family)